MIELHIEGSATLFDANEKFGAFTRFWGATKYRLAFLGRQAHTAPTPMAERKDALLAAAYLIADLKTLATENEPDLHTSVGRIEVFPNSPNTVPAEAVLFIELRSGAPEILAEAERKMKLRIDAAAELAAVGYEVRSIDRRKAGRFAPGLIALAERTARSYRETTRHLDTTGGHDAVALSDVCPAVVLAVRCREGVIHHPTDSRHMRITHSEPRYSPICFTGSHVMAWRRQKSKLLRNEEARKRHARARDNKPALGAEGIVMQAPSISEPDMDTYLAFANELADAARPLALSYFRTPLDVISKLDESPVTIADRTIEKHLRAMIEARFPQHGIHGEEWGVKPGNAFTWVIDPIDGTKSFITGFPLFGSLVSLTHDGEPLCGIIDIPVTAERWIGQPGSAQFCGKLTRTSGCKNVAAANFYTTSPDLFRDGMPRRSLGCRVLRN